MSVKLVKWGGDGHEANYKEFMISSESDVSSLPKKNTDPPAAAGSVAYLQNLTKIYLLGNDNVWREV